MKRLILTTCLCVLFASTVALADWDPGDPAKWIQLPDLTPTGIDVWNDGWERSIADDFLCTSKDPITDVHLWGSWLNDEHDAFLSRIRLYIYDDDPAGSEGPDPENQFSKPGVLRWEGEFTPSGINVDGSYTERVYYTLPGGEEMFLDPQTGEQVGTDTKVWQYNIDINPDKAFVQEGTIDEPRTYWLEVMAFPEWENEDYGWKTRALQDGHFMDDAVYKDAAGDWAPLVYPDGHPYEGMSIDMAFVITPEPATIALLSLGGLGLLRRKRKA